MNKAPLGGVGSNITEGQKKPLGKNRLFLRATRKSQKSSGELHEGEDAMPKLILGLNASNSTLKEKACPNVQSPKRPIPMEIDPTTPKSKRRMTTRKTRLASQPPNQQLLTNLWRKNAGKFDKDGSKDQDDDENVKKPEDQRE